MFDLASVSACDHAFFDYGTFGLWSGFLSKGSVFVPRMYRTAEVGRGK